MDILKRSKEGYEEINNNKKIEQSCAQSIKPKPCINIEIEASNNESRNTLLVSTYTQSQMSNKKSDRKRYERSRIKKYLKKLKIKRNVSYQYDYLNPFRIEKCISTQRLFNLAGGYLVEFQEDNNLIDNRVMFNSLKMIEKTQRFHDNSIKFTMGCVELIYDYSQIVKMLMHTQNLNDYKVATHLIQLQSVMSTINDTVERLIQSYDKYEIENLIQKRKEYINQYTQHYINKNLNPDDFYQIVYQNINWSQKTMMLTDCQLSPALIALLGASGDELINYVMRNTLFWIFTQETRKNFLISSLQYLLNSLNNQVYMDIPNVELQTIDNIIINTSTLITAFPIIFPPSLQFKGIDGNEILNNIESIAVLQYYITEQHLGKVIKTREEFIRSQKTPQNYLWCDLDEFIVDHFEFYMENYIFLQKFYSKKLESLEKEKQANQEKQDENYQMRCKYRLINQGFSSLKALSIYDSCQSDRVVQV